MYFYEPITIPLTLTYPNCALLAISKWQKFWLHATVKMEKTFRYFKWGPIQKTFVRKKYQKYSKGFVLVLHFVHISWYIIELKSFNKTIVVFWYRLTQYLPTKEVIITSAIVLGNYHFFWVDKSSCQPYQKSTVVQYCTRDDTIRLKDHKFWYYHIMAEHFYNRSAWK